MKSLFFVLLVVGSTTLNSLAAVPSLHTNAPISTVFYEFFQPYTNAVSWYVIPPKPGSPDHLITIIHPPLDRINEVGTHADFTVVATYKGPPIEYQWYKLSGISNRVAIQGATENVLCIEGVQSSDVAGYEVVLSQAGQEKTNLLANLSVMRIACTASVLGEIESPITAFTSSSSVSCGGGTFTKLYSPYSNGKPVLLYGPNIPSIYQVGEAINSTKMPKVTVSTHNPLIATSANPPADTGVRLQNSAYTVNRPSEIYDQCNDNAGVWPMDTQAAQIINPMSTSDNRYIATYKITIYYKGTPPNSGKVYWNWLYHNNP